MTQTSATTNIEPVMIMADHYQISSFTDEKIYDMNYDYTENKWRCTCHYGRTRYNSCKHVKRLTAWMMEDRRASQQAPAPEHHHSNSQELISVLTRIAKLENAMASVETEQHLVEKDLEEHNYQLDERSNQHSMLLGRLTGRELQIDKQQKDINLQRELIGRLQEDMGKLMALVNQQAETIENNRANHYAIIKELDGEVRQHAETIKQQQRTIDDQAQQIDKLHEAVSQQKPEQVVRIAIEGAIAKVQQARQERQPADEKVSRISKTECKAGRFTVKVVGNCAASCNCSIGKMDRQCGHMVKVDQFLSK